MSASGAAWATPQAIVIDNGTGYTKMGYAGNSEPTFVEPTAISAIDDGSSDIGRGGATDLDYYFGADALAHTKTHQISYPMRAGLIENWSNMERLWERCFYDRLHVQPANHFVLLTEPPLNPPENREYTAEVMFETFGVPGAHSRYHLTVAVTLAASLDHSLA